MKFVKSSGIILLVLLMSYVVFSDKESVNKTIKTDKYGTLTKELIKESIDKKIERREQGYAKSDNPDKYAEYLSSLKTGENGESYEGNYLINEFKKAKVRLAKLKSATAQLDWKERGPGNVGGRTRSLIVDPKDATGNTWFAGSVSGGVWRTTDAGSTWTCITPDIPNLATGCMTVSLADPNVIYVGTGEGFYNVDAVMGAGIFKSTDNGATWLQLPSTKDNSYFYYVNRIITDPGNVNGVIAATNSGVFKSIDGGDTWERKLSGGRVQQIIFETDNFLNQYAVINNTGIYKSTDGGDSWFKVKSIAEGRLEMAISVTDPNVVYALTSESNLYMSIDRGYNWVQNIQEPKTDFLSGQGWYNNSLIVSPNDTNIIFVGGVDIHNVTVGVDDAGGITQAYDIVSDTSDWITYDNFGGGYLDGGFSVNSGASALWDCKIDFLGDSTQKAHRFVYEGNTYVYKGLVDVPFTVNKTDYNINLNVSFIDDNDNGVFDLTETSNEYIYIHYTDYTGVEVDEIAVDNGLNVKNLYSLLPVMKTGKVWDAVNLASHRITVDNYSLKGKKLTSVKKTFWYKDVGDNKYAHADHHGLVIDKGNPFRLIDCCDGGISVSDDGGDNWSSPIHGYVTSQFYSVSKHPTENRYMGGLQDNGTWFSEEAPGNTSSWTEALGGDGFGTVWHSKKPEQMISSLYYNQLYRTDDMWKNGYNISKEIEDSGEDSDAPFITTIASSPDQPDLLFVAGPSGLWKSEDFGISWRNITINSYDYGYAGSSVQMLISSADPKIVWAGVRMDSGGKLNISVDQGNTFTAVKNFSQNIRRISRIVSHPFDSTVYVLNSAPGSAKIIRSSDLGQTWEDITGFVGNSSSSNGFPDVAVFSLVVIPSNTDEIWAGTEIGLFISTDNGLTWHYSDNGLPAVCIWDMKVVGDQVVLGTHGRGVWSVTIPELNNIPVKPYVIGAGVTADNRFKIRYDVKSDFDSLRYYFNDEVAGVQTGVAVGVNEYDIDFVSEQSVLNCQVIGFKKGMAFSSNLYFTDNFHFELPRVRYSNDFESYQNDFYGDGYTVNSSLEGNFAIHSEHTYKENKNHSYVLKYPVIVMEAIESSIMTYEDIAFVEKGEDGTGFGDAEFWDYVVVEGSKDGIEWLPLSDGYDFGYSRKWDDGNTDINSTPSSTKFINHTINFQDKFSVGDTILIRFRLYSDANTVGWGWVIDNINIQKDGTGIFNKVSTPDGELTISPNPVTNYINLRLDDSENGEVRVTVYDLSGRLLLNRNFVKNQQKWQQTLPVDNLGSGVKLINVYIGKDQYSQRIVVK